MHLDLLCFADNTLMSGKWSTRSRVFRDLNMPNNLLLYLCLPKIKMMKHTATMGFTLTLLLKSVILIMIMVLAIGTISPGIYLPSSYLAQDRHFFLCICSSSA